MSNILSAIAAIALSTTHTASNEQLEFIDRASAVAEEMFNIDSLSIEFVDDLSDHVPGDNVAATVCSPSTGECEILIDRCMIRADQRIFENLVVHEIAHVVNYQVNGEYDHGREWRSIMRALNATPREHYQYNRVPSCGDGSHLLSRFGY